MSETAENSHYSVVLSSDKARAKLPATKALANLLEASDDFVHVRSLCWIVLCHVRHEVVHELETVCALGDIQIPVRTKKRNN